MKRLTYKNTGVNIDNAEHFVNIIKGIAKEIGSFGIFPLDADDMADPVLVSSADGVGTKLKIACMAGKHDTIGIDLVAMCINDIVRYGASPLFFLDYISIGKLEIETATEIVKGIAKGCEEADAFLIGGETAEMPGHYKKREYDLAGFAVGIADSSDIINGSAICVGDKVVGIASSGLHSNGFSLVRKVCFDMLGLKIDSYIPELGHTIGEELLIPTKIYAKTVKTIISEIPVSAFFHITGGGISKNIVEKVGSPYKIVINKGSWEIPTIFEFLQKAGNIEEEEMMRTFNNGIGMAAIVREKHVDTLLSLLKNIGQKAFMIGEVVKARI